MTEYELPQEVVQKLRRIEAQLNQLADEAFFEPINPKLSGLLQIAADMIDDQIVQNSYYCYDDFEPINQEEPRGLKFFSEESQPPSSDDLERWLSDGAPNE